jgi:hypothetical protein
MAYRPLPTSDGHQNKRVSSVPQVVNFLKQGEVLGCGVVSADFPRVKYMQSAISGIRLSFAGPPFQLPARSVQPLQHPCQIRLRQTASNVQETDILRLQRYRPVEGIQCAAFVELTGIFNGAPKVSA